MDDNVKSDTSIRNIMDTEINIRKSKLDGNTITSYSDNESDVGSMVSLESNDTLNHNTDQDMPITDDGEANSHRCGQCLRSFYSLEAVQLHGRLGFCIPKKVQKLKRRRRRKWFNCNQCLRKFRDAEAFSMHANLCKANILIDMVENWSRITGDKGDVYTCTLCTRRYHDLTAFHLHNISALHKRRLNNNDKTSLLSDENLRTDTNSFKQRSKQILNTAALNKMRFSYKYRKRKKTGHFKPIGRKVNVSDKKSFVNTCDFCYKKFNNIHALKIHQSCEKHRKQDRKLGDMRCNVAGLPTGDHLANINNIKTDRVSNRHQCTTCLRQYTNERALKIHSVFTCSGNQFDLPELYTCDVCYKSFQSMRALKIHQFRIKHRPDDVKLDTRAEVTPNSTSEMNTLQLWTCNTCSKSFSSLHSINIHLGRQKHTLGFTVSECSELDRKSCNSKLGKVISNSVRSSNDQSSDLKLSINTKTVSGITNDELIMDIGVPNLMDSSQSAIPQIELKHKSGGLKRDREMADSVSGITSNLADVCKITYTCSVCLRKYPRIQALKIHQQQMGHAPDETIARQNQAKSQQDENVLQKDDSFTCSICSHEFSSTNSLKIHLELVHNSEFQSQHAESGIKNSMAVSSMSCDVCKRQFTSMHALSTHQSWTKHQQGGEHHELPIKSIVGNVGKVPEFPMKKYSCVVCQRQFKTHAGLLIHQTRMDHKPKLEIKQKHMKAVKRSENLSGDTNTTLSKIRLPTISCHGSNKEFPYLGMRKDQQETVEHALVNDDSSSGLPKDNTVNQQTILGMGEEQEVKEVLGAERHLSVIDKYVCAICCRKFFNWHGLRIHQVQMKHEQITKIGYNHRASVPVNKASQNYQCVVCNIEFDEYHAFCIHQKLAQCHRKREEKCVASNACSVTKMEMLPPTAMEIVSKPVVSLEVPNEMVIHKAGTGVISSGVSIEAASRIQIPPSAGGILQTGTVLKTSTDIPSKTYKCSLCYTIFNGRGPLYQHKKLYGLNCHNNVINTELTLKPIQRKMQNSVDNISPGAVSEAVVGRKTQVVPIDLSINRSIDNNVPTSSIEIQSGNGLCNILLQDAVWSVANPEPRNKEGNAKCVAENRKPWIFHEYLPPNETDYKKHFSCTGPKQKHNRFYSIPSDAIKLADCQLSEWSRSRSLSTPSSLINQSPVIPNSDDASDCILEKSFNDHPHSILESHYKCSFCSKPLPTKRAFDFHIFVEHSTEVKAYETNTDGMNTRTVTGTKLLSGVSGQKCTISYYAASDQRSEKPIMRTHTVIQSPRRNNVVQSNDKCESKHPYTPGYSNSSSSVISISDDEGDDQGNDATPSAVAPYKCTVCEAVFASRERIEEHNLVHIKEEAMRVFGLSCIYAYINHKDT